MGHAFTEVFNLWRAGALPYQQNPMFRRPTVAETTHVGNRMDRPAALSQNEASPRGMMRAGWYGRGERYRPGESTFPYQHPQVYDTRYRAEWYPGDGPAGWPGMSASQTAHSPAVRVDAYGRSPFNRVQYNRRPYDQFDGQEA